MGYAVRGPIQKQINLKNDMQHAILWLKKRYVKKECLLLGIHSSNSKYDICKQRSFGPTMRSNY